MIATPEGHQDETVKWVILIEIHEDLGRWMDCRLVDSQLVTPWSEEWVVCNQVYECCKSVDEE